MKIIAMWNTKIGPFYIGYKNGRYHAIFNNHGLGKYEHPQHAVDDLVCSATYSVLHPETSEPVDTDELGFPEDFLDWERM